jgi:hypothetical protein
LRCARAIPCAREEHIFVLVKVELSFLSSMCRVKGMIMSRAAGRVVIFEQHSSSQGNDISRPAAPARKIYLLSLGLVQLELFLRFRAGPPLSSMRRVKGMIISRVAGRVVIFEQHASGQGNDISRAAAPVRKIHLCSLGLIQPELFLRFRAGPPSPRRLLAHAEFRGFLVSRRLDPPHPLTIQ